MNKHLTLTLTKWATLLSCVAGLAACSLLPRYERPPAPTPTAWPGQTDSTAAPAVLPSWQDYFANAPLRQLIDLALANNRDLRLAVLNIEQARAQLGIRSADQFPTLNAGVTGSRIPAKGGGIDSAYAAGLSVTAYEFDFFGRVASLKEQAQAQYLATTEGRNIAQISLIATVAQTWLGLLADEELLSVTRQTLASREESLKLIELKLKHGAASELDRQLAQTLLQSARVTLAQQERQRMLDENALVLLLGQALPSQVKLSFKLSEMHLTELPAGLPSELLVRRPDIRQAEQLLMAGNANIGAARAAFFPRISLATSIGSASNDLTALFTDGSWGWTLAPQLLLPIWDAGRNQSALASAKAARDMGVAQYEKAIQTAFREVADSLAGRTTLTQQLHAQQALLDAETGRSHLVKLRLDHGAASQLDWLDAQRSLFASQQALTHTRLASLQNQVNLYNTLGGGI